MWDTGMPPPGCQEQGWAQGGGCNAKAAPGEAQKIPVLGAEPGCPACTQLFPGEQAANPPHPAEQPGVTHLPRHPTAHPGPEHPFPGRCGWGN